MKSKLMRLVAMLLVLASLVSAFAVFAFAEEAPDATTPDDGATDDTTGDDGTDSGNKSDLDKVKEEFPDFDLLYQRSYNEGWDAFNGMDVIANNVRSAMSIDYEQTADYSYNYFMRFTTVSSQNDYIRITLNSNRKMGTVFEFDIKSDDYANIGSMMHAATVGDGTTRTNFNLLKVSNNELYLFDDSSKSFSLNDEWLHVVYVMDLTYGNEEKPTGEVDSEGNPITETVECTNKLKVYAYCSPKAKDGEEQKYELVEEKVINIKTEALGKALQYINIGSPTGSVSSNFGSSVCFDNIVIYNGANKPGLATSSMGYGTKINLDASKTVEILGGSTGEVTTADFFDAGVALKVGVNYGRFKGKKAAILTNDNGDAYGAPVEINGNVMIALLPVLDAINYPYYIHEDGIYVDISAGDSASYIAIGKTTATVNGQTVELNAAPAYITDKNGNEFLAVERVDLQAILSGWYVDYDELGLITITQKEDIINRDSNLNTMLDLMKDFIFENPEGDEIYDDVKENTDNFTHPYIFGTQEEFDKIRAAYLATPGDDNYDAYLQSALQGLVDSANWYYKRLAHWTNTQSYIPKITTYNIKDAGLTEVFCDKDGNAVTELRLTDDGMFVTVGGDPVYNSADVENRLRYVGMRETDGNFDATLHVVAPDAVYTNATTSYDVDLYYQDGTKADTHTFYIDIASGNLISFDYNGKEAIYDKDGNKITTLPNTWKYEDSEWYWDDDYYRAMTEEELYEFHGATAYQKNWSLAMNYSSQSVAGQEGAPSAGYDPAGGRNTASTRAGYLTYLAAGWIVSHDVKFLLLGYQVAVRLGQWDHWGPGHFLNCADTSAPYAQFIDWTYNAYVDAYNGTVGGKGELTATDIEKFRTSYDAKNAKSDNKYYDIQVLFGKLYDHGVYEGWLASNNIATQWVSTIVGTGGSYYNTRTNNWNAVCSSGMVIASLVLFSSKEDEHIEKAKWLASDNIKNLAKYGLDCYAPDGAYPEGTSYWSYGTNNFFEMCMALSSAAGTTYGLMECWGIDETCYYACYTESSDGKTFAYNDGGVQSQDTSMFFYVGSYFGDTTISQIRMKQLTGRSKSFTIYDLFVYPFDGIDGEGDDLQLDYFSNNLDLYTSRSSWDKGATFIAAMAGPNTMSHGQIDCGSFMYANLGTVWFTDLGTENYNAKGFWQESAERYRYYVMKPEGNNTIALASSLEVPYGQTLSGTGNTEEYDSNQYGSYIRYDMTEVFGGLASTWERGFMLTNSRTTTVIQDDIDFGDGVQTVYWFGHFDTNTVDVKLSSDGRTAYMYLKSESNKNKKTTCIRVSLVANKRSYKFEIWDAYTFVHMSEGGKDPVTEEKANNGIVSNPNYTLDRNYSTANGGDAEKNRDKYNKLVIRGESTLAFNVAVVIESIDPETVGTNAEPDVGYEYGSMKSWVPTESYEKEEVSDETVRGNASLKYLAGNIAAAEGIVEDGTQFGEDFEDFYSALAEANYIIKAFKGESALNKYSKQVESFNTMKALYDNYLRSLRTVTAVPNAIFKSLTCGI